MERKCAICGGIAKVKGRALVSVCCISCGARGPQKSSRADAIYAWDKMQRAIQQSNRNEKQIDLIKEILTESEDKT